MAEHATAVCRLDVASCMTAEALIGRQVKIFWPEDDAWYSGEVVAYDDIYGRHHVWTSSHDQLCISNAHAVCHTVHAQFLPCD